MLTSVVIDPLCFTNRALQEPEVRFGAEQLLDGVIKNGVFLADDARTFLQELVSSVTTLSSTSGQRVQLLVAEIAKTPHRYVAAARRPLYTTSPSNRLSLMAAVAGAMRADVIICQCDSDVRRLSTLNQPPIEACTLSGYNMSRAETKRNTWYRTTRIDTLPTSVCNEIVGRVLKYTNEILIADRFFAIAANSGWPNPRLRRFAAGVVFLANCWCRDSPYNSRSRPILHIVSVVGNTSAAGQYVDPRVVEANIRTAIAALDTQNSVGSIVISLKHDRHPRIANDRFLFGKGRCFGVMHGIDDIGNLAAPQSARRPTSLVPDCDDHRALLVEIRSLKAAT